jgi:hypothetical protein
MTHFIIQWIDTGIIILAAVLLLRFYFHPKVGWLYKKKWVLFVCAGMILYSLAEAGLGCRKYFSSRIPSRASLEKTIPGNGQAVTADFILSSGDGYELLIPAGYTYVTPRKGGLSLTATREYSAFVVFKASAQASLDNIMDNTLAGLQKNNPDFKLNDRRRIIVSGSEALRSDFSVVKNNVPARSILLLCRKGNALFQLSFSCPEAQFDKLQAEYERIIQSFKIN